jgi:hypothetical protein
MHTPQFPYSRQTTQRLHTTTITWRFPHIHHGQEATYWVVVGRSVPAGSIQPCIATTAVTIMIDDDDVSLISTDSVLASSTTSSSSGRLSSMSGDLPVWPPNEKLPSSSRCQWNRVVIAAVEMDVCCNIRFRSTGMTMTMTPLGSFLD